MEYIGNKKKQGSIVELLRDEILAGNIPDGSEMTQNELAEGLGVSRMPVREALILLEYQGLIDRLELTPDRLQAMADGLLQIASLPDPVGEVASMKPRPNGLLIGEKRVPLGVVGMIYEARPNVTSDAFGLCFKTGNAVILKGGSDAIESNKEIVKWLRTGSPARESPVRSHFTIS